MKHFLNDNAVGLTISAKFAMKARTTTVEVTHVSNFCLSVI